MLLAHQNEEHARESAYALLDLGGRARKLLEECVEHQIVIKPKISKTADQLEVAGFLFILKTGTSLTPEFTYQPSLFGEEALEALELLESTDQL